MPPLVVYRRFLAGFIFAVFLLLLPLLLLLLPRDFLPRVAVPPPDAIVCDLLSALVVGDAFTGPCEDGQAKVVGTDGFFGESVILERIGLGSRLLPDEGHELAVGHFVRNLMRGFDDWGGCADVVDELVTPRGKIGVKAGGELGEGDGVAGLLGGVAPVHEALEVGEAAHVNFLVGHEVVAGVGTVYAVEL